MPKPMRQIIEADEPGTLPPERIDEVVRGVHVVPLEDGRWEVFKHGRRRISEAYPTEQSALSRAESLSREYGVALFPHREVVPGRRAGRVGRVASG